MGCDCQKKKVLICGKRFRKNKLPPKADILTSKAQKSDKKITLSYLSNVPQSSLGHYYIN
jgi:hypothetical protein